MTFISTCFAIYCDKNMMLIDVSCTLWKVLYNYLHEYSTVFFMFITAGWVGDFCFDCLLNVYFFIYILIYFLISFILLRGAGFLLLVDFGKGDIPSLKLTNHVLILFFTHFTYLYIHIYEDFAYTVKLLIRTIGT